MASNLRVVALMLALSAGSAVSLAEAAAHAQSLSDKETARALMDEGDAKRDKGDLKGALKAYTAADSIMQVPSTAIEVANTEIKLGLLLEAKETLTRIGRMAVKPNEPAPFATARKNAETMLADVSARIPSITIAIANADASSATVTVDGENVATAALSVPRKVNPGPHTVVAKVGGNEKKQDVTIAEKETRAVTIDFKPDATPPPPPPPEEHGAKMGTGKILMFGGFGVAALGIGIGAVTGLMSMSKVDDIKKNCNGNACPTTEQDNIDSATTLGTVSTVGFVVGILGAGVGVLGIVLNGKEKASDDSPPATASATHINVRPVVSPTYWGLSGTF